MWKNEKFSLTRKIFRQIDSLVISLVKTLFSLIFCQNCVRLQGGPTRNGFFEFNILGTYSVATIDFDTSNFSKHADI